MAAAPGAATDGQGEEAALSDIVRARSFAKGDFLLSSGRRSPLYFNMKPTMMDPQGALLSARAFLRRAIAAKAEFMGGLEMGAVPVISAVAAVSQVDGVPLRTFFVRKQRKEHGAGLLIEGVAETDLAQKRVVVADDVATTGGSILQAVDAARAAGAQVETAVCLLDREEGAAEMLERHGVRLESVFRASAFV